MDLVLIVRHQPEGVSTGSAGTENGGIIRSQCDSVPIDPIQAICFCRRLGNIIPTSHHQTSIQRTEGITYTRPFVGSEIACQEKASRNEYPERLSVLEYDAASAHPETARATKARNEDFIIEEGQWGWFLLFQHPFIQNGKTTEILDQAFIVWIQTHGIISRQAEWRMFLASETYDDTKINPVNEYLTVKLL